MDYNFYYNIKKSKKIYIRIYIYKRNLFIRNCIFLIFILFLEIENIKPRIKLNLKIEISI